MFLPSPTHLGTRFPLPLPLRLLLRIPSAAFLLPLLALTAPHPTQAAPPLPRPVIQKPVQKSDRVAHNPDRVAHNPDSALPKPDRVLLQLDPKAIPAQEDNSSCGPNSAARLVRYYGGDTSAEQIRSRAAQADVLTQFGLGTSPAALRDAIRSSGIDATLERGADLETLLARLREGRPVIALVRHGTLPVAPAPLRLAPSTTLLGHCFDTLHQKLATAPQLHWFLVTGYNRASRTLHILDTDQSRRTLSFKQFQSVWNWDPGDPVIRTAFDAHGVAPRTIVY